MSKLNKEGYIAMNVDSTEAIKCVKVTLTSANYGGAVGVNHAAEAMKLAVIKSFMDTSTNTGIINRPSTILFKGNKPPLMDSGSLLQSLLDGEAKMVTASVTNGKSNIVAEYSFNPPTAGSDVMFPELGQVRKNPDYQYWIVHEYGGKTPVHPFGLYQNKMFIMPKRSFLRAGLKKGVRDGVAVIMSDTLAEIKKGLKKFKASPWVRLNMEREMQTQTWDFISVALPPSAIYAQIGMGFDITGFMQGTFTSIRVDNWLMAFAKGQGGLTKKVQRRKMRRKLWGVLDG